MNRFFIFISVISLTLSACSSMNRAQKGAIAGGAVGGVAGGAAKGGKGAIIGGAAGAIAGGAIGAYLDHRQKELSRVVETRKTEHGLLITMKSDLLFDFNQAAVKANARQNLSDLAEILAKYPKDNLEVAGYTDHIGAEAYNKRLSQQRAEAVRDFLKSQGVKNFITARGMGEIAGTGNDPAAVSKNRKVEIYIDVAAPQTAAQND